MAITKARRAIGSKNPKSEWVIARARATSAGGHTRVCRRATTRRCSTRSSIVLISSSSTTTTLHYYAKSLSISFSPVDKGKPNEAGRAPTLFFSSFGGCSARSQFDVTFCDTTRSAYRTPKLLIRIGVPRNGQRQQNDNAKFRNVSRGPTHRFEPA